MVERHEVDVLGREAAGGERGGDRVVLVRQQRLREPLAVALDQLGVERRLARPLRHGRLPAERLEPAVEVLELHDHEAVEDVDVGVHRPAGRAAERVARRVAGAHQVDGAHAADRPLRLEAPPEVVGGGADGLQAVAPRPGARWPRRTRGRAGGRRSPGSRWRPWRQDTLERARVPRPVLRSPPALDALRRHRHRRGDRPGRRARRGGRGAAHRPRQPRRHRASARRAGTGARCCWRGTRCRRPTRNHMLAFGVDEEIDWEGLTPAPDRRCGARGRAASGSPRTPSRRRRIASGASARSGESMRWDDLECLDGIEVWSFVSDNGQNVNGVARRAALHRAPRALRDPPAAAQPRRVGPARRAAAGGRHRRPRRPPVRRAGSSASALRLMSYHRSFRQLRTNVLVREPLDGNLEHDRELVFEALREGRCYIAAHAVAPGRGFRFSAEGVEMGAEAPFAGQELHVELPRPAEVRLLRDGDEVAPRRRRLAVPPRRGAGRLPRRGLPRDLRAAAHLDPLEPRVPAMTEVRLDPGAIAPRAARSRPQPLAPGARAGRHRLPGRRARARPARLDGRRGHARVDRRGPAVAARRSPTS